MSNEKVMKGQPFLIGKITSPSIDSITNESFCPPSPSIFGTTLNN